MKRRVLKWDVLVDDREHEIGGGRVRLVACQHSHDVVQVWTEETDHPDWEFAARPRMVRVFGTGQPLPEAANHLGSVVTAGGALVWHVYEVRP